MVFGRPALNESKIKKKEKKMSINLDTTIFLQKENSGIPLIGPGEVKPENQKPKEKKEEDCTPNFCLRGITTIRE
jgi:hypothetical protein